MSRAGRERRLDRVVNELCGFEGHARAATAAVADADVSAGRR